MGCDQLVTAPCKAGFLLGRCARFSTTRVQGGLLVKIHPRRYLIEIKDAKGSVLFSAAACWDDKDKRIALAQITRLARLPEVNFYAEPALAPQSGNSGRRPRRLPGTRVEPS